MQSQADNDDDDDANRGLMLPGSRFSWDANDERGFDVPLVPQMRAPSMMYDRSSSVLPHNGVQVSQENLKPHEPNQDPEAREDDGLRARALDQEPQDKSNRRRQSFLTGWRAGVAASAIMTTVILVINVVITVWASLQFEVNDGIGNAYIGDCSVVNTWSTILHVFINGLSSALLGASNYTMQCLTAPTRKECDIAHAHQDWLDIGIPSVRNLGRIRWSRRIAWGLLALSGIPIHLLYNSAVFKQLDDNAQTHNTLLVSPQFVDNADIKLGPFPTYDNGTLTWTIDGKNISRDAQDFWGNESDYQYDRYKSELDWYHKPIASQMRDIYSSSHSAFDKVDPKACFEMYDASLLSGHSHSFFVLNGLVDFDGLTAGTGNIWPNWTNYFLPGTDMQTMPLFW